jgi:hypothetical protein
VRVGRPEQSADQTPADIFEMAKVDRVAGVMRPYLEALT